MKFYYMDVEGIKKEVSNNLYIYHITGFGQDIIFNRNDRKINIIQQETNEVLQTFEASEDLNYLEFQLFCHRLHKVLIEDHLVGFIHLDPYCNN